MFHLHKATHVTSSDDASTQRWLAEHYSYPADSGADTPFVRANMVVSVDGAVTVDGRSGALGGHGDKLLFSTLRGLADVVLVGTGTAISEDYGQPSAPESLAGLRRANGQHDAPALALVSRSLSMPVSYPPLTHPDTIVLTCRSAPADRREALRAAGATLVDCGEETVETPAMLATCAARGWTRVLCEGGPTLLGTVIVDDALDELCITTSPHAVAGRSGRMAATPAEVMHRLMPASVLGDDEGYLYTRWVRRERPAAPH